MVPSVRGSSYDSSIHGTGTSNGNIMSIIMNENVNEARVPVGEAAILRLPTIGCSGFLWEPCDADSGGEVTRRVEVADNGTDTCGGGGQEDFWEECFRACQDSSEEELTHSRRKAPLIWTLHSRAQVHNVTGF